jgi:hypothetical protein
MQHPMPCMIQHTRLSLSLPPSLSLSRDIAPPPPLPRALSLPPRPGLPKHTVESDHQGPRTAGTNHTAIRSQRRGCPAKAAGIAPKGISIPPHPRTYIMCVCVRVCVCVCVFVCVCKHVCMYACTHVYVCQNVDVCMYVRTHTLSHTARGLAGFKLLF